MAISVTEFKAKCLHLIRQVEAYGTPIYIVRRGRVVARLTSAVPLDGGPSGKPWERLRGTGRLEAEPGESVLSDSDFRSNVLSVLLDTHVWIWCRFPQPSACGKLKC